jgi:glycogen operon protein
MLNMDDCARRFDLPVLDGRRWCRIIDTAQESPNDIVSALQHAPIEQETSCVDARSVVVLEAI